MNPILTAALLSAFSLQAAQEKPPSAIMGRYDMHLYFDEKPYLDTMDLHPSWTGISGIMRVPNDFIAIF